MSTFGNPEKRFNLPEIVLKHVMIKSRKLKNFSCKCEWVYPYTSFS